MQFVEQFFDDPKYFPNKKFVKPIIIYNGEDFDLPVAIVYKNGSIADGTTGMRSKADLEAMIVKNSGYINYISLYFFT